MSEEEITPPMSGDEIPEEERKRQLKKKRKRYILIGVNVAGLIIILTLGLLLAKEISKGPVVLRPSPEIVQVEPSPDFEASPSSELGKMNKRLQRLEQKIQTAGDLEKMNPPILDFELEYEIEK